MSFKLGLIEKKFRVFIILEYPQLGLFLWREILYRCGELQIVLFDLLLMNDSRPFQSLNNVQKISASTPSAEMKPNPFALLNHFTIPISIKDLSRLSLLKQ